jgi:hypothetical protein
VPSDLTPQDREALGLAARAIVRYALSQDRADRWLYSGAFPVACRTYATNPVDTATVIRELLQPDRLTRHGFAALHWLASEIPALVRHDPALVGEIYTQGFTHQDASEEQTPLGGALLPLVSTRKQDYDHGLYELARVYADFVQAAPLEATRALVNVVDAWVVRDHTYGESAVETAVDILGRRTILRTDFSHSWDEGGAYEHQHERRMLDAWQEALDRLAQSENGVETLRKVVDIVAATNRMAVVWRRLFILGTKHAAVGAQVLTPLLFSPGVLASMDLEDVAGDFLAAAFSYLSDGDRASVERSILAVPGLSDVSNGDKVRNRLLGRLPADALVTDEAREVLRGIGEPPAPRRRHPGVTVGFGVPDREEDILRERGVPVDEPQNRALRERGERLSGLAARFRTKTAGPGDAGPALDLVRELRDALEAAPREGVHPEQAKRSLGMLADACAEIAEHGEGPAFESGLPLLTACLLDAAEAPDEEVRQGGDSGFDEHPFWSATPHISAAAGLLSIAWHGTDERLLRVIDELSRHPAKEVRFQVAWRSRTLLRSAPEFFWSLADRLAHAEESPDVLQGLLSSLQHVAGRDPDRGAAIAKTIYDRIKDHPKGKTARESCIDILVGLYVWQGQVDCGAFVANVARDPIRHLEAAAHLPFRLREPMVQGPVTPPEEKADAIRERAYGAFCSLTRSAVAAWHALVARSHTGPPPDPGQSKEAEALAHLLDSLAAELYFASGSFKESSRAREQGPLPEDVRRRFYIELGPAMDDLAEVGLPSLAHHLVETLEDIVAFDPPGVFRRVAAVVKAAQRYGYTYESLAADRIVKLVRRYLADYRPLLQEDARSRQALMEVLSAFVHWPEASRLVFQLEDIWR